MIAAQEHLSLRGYEEQNEDEAYVLYQWHEADDVMAETLINNSYNLKPN